MKKSIMFGLCFLSIINAQEKGPASPIIFANLQSELKSQMASPSPEQRFSADSIEVLREQSELKSQMASPSPEQLFSADSIEGLGEQSDQLGKAIAARLERLIDQVGRDQSTSPSDSDDQPNSSQDSPSAEQDILGEAFQGFATLNRQQQQALEEILRITGQNTRATQLLGQVVTAQSRLLIDVQEGHKSLLEEIAALRLARESDRQAQNKREQENRERCHEWLLEIRNQSGRNEALALIGGVLFGIGFACQMILDNINAASSGHH